MVVESPELHRNAILVILLNLSVAIMTDTTNVTALPQETLSVRQDLPVRVQSAKTSKKMAIANTVRTAISLMIPGHLIQV